MKNNSKKILQRIFCVITITLFLYDGFLFAQGPVGHWQTGATGNPPAPPPDGVNATNNLLGTPAGVDLRFGVNGGTEAMRILGSGVGVGRVGIGLSLPASKLQLHDVTGGALAIQFTNTTTGSALATNGFRIGIISTGEAFVQQNQMRRMDVYL